MKFKSFICLILVFFSNNLYSLSLKKFIEKDYFLEETENKLYYIPCENSKVAFIYNIFGNLLYLDSFFHKTNFKFYVPYELTENKLIFTTKNPYDFKEKGQFSIYLKSKKSFLINSLNLISPNYNAEKLKLINFVAIFSNYKNVYYKVLPILNNNLTFKVNGVLKSKTLQIFYSFWNQNENFNKNYNLEFINTEKKASQNIFYKNFIYLCFSDDTEILKKRTKFTILNNDYNIPNN